VDALTTYEVEAVVVVVHAAVNMNSMQLDVARLNDANRVIRALRKKDVADRDILALMKEEMIRTVISSATRGRGHSSLGTAELRSLAIDGTWSLNREVFSSDSKQKTNVAIVKR
jgi:hypothetical protein